jgi:hypothetical protein
LARPAAHYRSEPKREIWIVQKSELGKWQDFDKQFWVQERLAHSYAQNLRRDGDSTDCYRVHKFVEAEA